MRGRITAVVAAAAAAVGAAGVTRWLRGRKDDRRQEPQTGSRGQPDRAAAQPDPAAPPIGPDPASDPPASGAAPAASPAVEDDAQESTDDLTAIKGLGKVKAAKLVAAGVTSYAQVAAWTDDDIAEMGRVSNTSPGQIKREDWVGQARALAES